MRGFRKSSLIIIVLTFIYLIISRFIQIRYKIDIKTFDFVYLFCICLILFLLKYKFKGRIRYKTEKNQMILIVIMIYYILFFAIGLVFGYQKTIYDHSLYGIVKNFISIIIPLIFMEYIRYNFVRSCSKFKLGIILITCFLIFFELNLSAIILLNGSREALFKYFTSTIFPIMLRNIFLSYVAYIGGLSSLLLYVIPIRCFEIIVPILPSTDWFTTMLYQAILICILYFVLRNIEKRTDEVGRHYFKKWNITYNVMFIVIFFVLIFFIAGFFKYQPIAIVSDSMKDAFQRGDAVIVNKISSSEKISLGDIIAYKKNNSIIVHRVILVDVTINGDYIYVTKGDNNKNIDNWKVSKDEIIGTVNYKIPFVGYPTVWINDYFNR